MPAPSVEDSKLQELLTYCLNSAREKLSEHGRFSPFGGTLTPDGKVVAVGAPEGDGAPSGGELAQALISSFHKEYSEGEITAAALTANVDVPEKYKADYNDGIRVSLEHAGFSRHYFLPYQQSDDGYKYGSVFAVEVQPWLLTG